MSRTNRRDELKTGVLREPGDVEDGPVIEVGSVELLKGSRNLELIDRRCIQQERISVHAGTDTWLGANVWGDVVGGACIGFEKWLSRRDEGHPVKERRVRLVAVDATRGIEIKHGYDVGRIVGADQEDDCGRHCGLYQDRKS